MRHGEVYFWEVLNNGPRCERNCPIGLRWSAGYCQVVSDDSMIYKFDSREVAEECVKYIMNGGTMGGYMARGCTFDVWFDYRNSRGILRTTT
jgi:hypothetical protein